MIRRHIKASCTQESPVLRIFGGETRSSVAVGNGRNVKSANIEPFFALPVDINVSTIWSGLKRRPL